MAHHDGSKSGRKAPHHNITRGIHKEPSHIGLEKGVHEDKRLHSAFTAHTKEKSVKHSRHHAPAGHPMASKKGCK
jgi:hypothetical protein